MSPCLTTTGGKFLLDRCTSIGTHQGLGYFRTFAGNIVRQNADGTWQQIALPVLEANILNLPYSIAAELFPANAALVETV